MDANDIICCNNAMAACDVSPNLPKVKAIEAIIKLIAEAPLAGYRRPESKRTGMGYLRGLAVAHLVCRCQSGQRRRKRRFAPPHQKETNVEMHSERRSVLTAGLGLATAGTMGLLGACAPPVASKRGARTYVLVHGAWHGGWVWKGVAQALRTMGHEVYAPSLTGLGDRRHLLNPTINLDTHADDVVNLIEMEDLKDIVLVGWSYGGMVASEVLARTTARIGAMVYLDAFVPERGKALVDYAGPPAERFRQAAAKGQDISAIPLGVFGVTDSVVIAHVTPRLSLQPAQTFVQPSKALAERPRIPHTYVRASGFASAGFDAFLKKFQEDPAAKAVTIPTSHLLMLTDPAATIRLLAEAA
jgi:pimeloyl-ACP methyl ester carboxylesterase